MTHTSLPVCAGTRAHTYIHTLEHIHHGAWQKGCFMRSVLCQPLCVLEMISYSPASLPTLTLPLSVYCQGVHCHALSFTIFFFLGYLFNNNATFSLCHKSIAELKCGLEQKSLIMMTECLFSKLPFCDP